MGLCDDDGVVEGLNVQSIILGLGGGGRGVFSWGNAGMGWQIYLRLRIMGLPCWCLQHETTNQTEAEEAVDGQ